MFTLKILKHLLTLLLVKLPLQLIAIPIVAIELLFHLKDKRTINCPDQRLLLEWFDVGDELDRKYGLNGDLGYQQSRKNPTTTFGIYKMRLTWLAFRNPINYFQHNILGEHVSNLGDITLKSNYINDLKEENELLEVSDWHYAGARKVLLSTGHWEYYIVYKYPFKQDKCLRIRLGYKLGHRPLQHLRLTVQWVFVFQPWKDYIGR
jgi:hypothetical protein